MIIELTQGKITQIDEVDRDLARWKWRALKAPHTFYAVRTAAHPYNCAIYLHRVILGIQNPKTGENLAPDLEVDHRDADGLNNRRSNLRRCTHAQQQSCSRRTRGRTTSRFRGIRFHRNRWYAQITCAKKAHHLGCFDHEEDAAHVYDEAAKRLHGEFARLNFPDGGN